MKLNKKVLKYDELVIEIKNAIKQVKKENYKNYFENAYNKDAYKDYVKKDSTLKRKRLIKKYFIFLLNPLLQNNFKNYFDENQKIIKINLSIYH